MRKRLQSFINIKRFIPSEKENHQYGYFSFVYMYYPLNPCYTYAILLKQRKWILWILGFGKFNIKVTILCGLIYMNTGFSISSVGFILPSAACDLELSTIDKGRISAIPLLGLFDFIYINKKF